MSCGTHDIENFIEHFLLIDDDCWEITIKSNWFVHLGAQLS